MINIKDYLDDPNLKTHPWLIIGKGPSYSKIVDYQVDNYKTVSLNHVIKEQEVDIAHLIDFDVFTSCSKEIDQNSKYLLMPYYPHFDNKPTNENLDSLIDQNKLLKKLNMESRLLWYNLGTTSKQKGSYPLIDGGLFSGDVLFNVLAKSGAKQISSIGVDGGNDYDNKYNYLNKTTLLSNGQNSFDVQFQNIRSHIVHYGVSYKKLDESFPINVYVATTEAQMLATKVLEYSIKKNSSFDINVVPIHKKNRAYPEPNEIENRQRTPFSFQRFLIPELNSYTGKAIYLDSDMQVFDDIVELWGLPMGSNDLLTVKPSKLSGRRLQFSVMLLDCSKLKWSIDKIIDDLNNTLFNYHSLMHDMCIAENISADIDPNWNSLESYEEGKTKLLHYTEMTEQPWISTKNLNESIWMKDLFEAIESKFINIDFVKNHIDKGWIRPGILYQIENKILTSQKLPKNILKKDIAFKPPYKELVCSYSHPSDTLFENILLKLVNIKKRILSS